MSPLTIAIIAYFGASPLIAVLAGRAIRLGRSGPR